VPTLRAVALAKNRIDLLVNPGNASLVQSLVITQPWRCLANETGVCNDGIDNDCDGTLDDHDTECP
jgi:hypothetical protein